MLLDYVEQPNNYTCQSAAIARLIGTTDVMDVRDRLDRIASDHGSNAGDPEVMAIFLRRCVENGKIDAYKFIRKGSLNMAIEALDAGMKIITHGWLTEEGHVFGLDGWDQKSKCFRVKDPWAHFHFPSWTYPEGGGNGNNQRYSSLAIYAACVASSSAGQAIQIYAEGIVRYDEADMWLHVVKPSISN